MTPRDGAGPSAETSRHLGAWEGSRKTAARQPAGRDERARTSQIHASVEAFSPRLKKLVVALVANFLALQVLWLPHISRQEHRHGPRFRCRHAEGSAGALTSPPPWPFLPFHIVQQVADLPKSLASGSPSTRALESCLVNRDKRSEAGLALVCLVRVGDLYL